MVSVITSTNRNESIHNVFQNYEHQSIEKKELIIILHGPQMDEKKWVNESKQFSNVKIYTASNERTLGECLNIAVKHAKYPIISKFDDDDYYAPSYLQEALLGLKKTNADIVGKVSVLMYFQRMRLLTIHRPFNENIFIKKPLLKGATLTFKKEVFEQIQFPLKNRREDAFFQKQCLLRGCKLYSSTKNNYLCIRNENIHQHTWRASEEQLLKKSTVLKEVDDFHALINQLKGNS